MRILAVFGACVLALSVAGCDAAPKTETTATPARNDTATETAPLTPAEVPQNGPAEQWVMPDLTGAVLQDAQDAIQQLTGDAVYFTESHDLSGRNRNQVLDDNWKVCDQNIAAGATLSATSRIDFGVVKLDESCP